MNMHSIGKRSTAILVFPAIVSAVLLLGSGCYAGDDPVFEGSWTGELQASGGANSSVVNLFLKAGQDKSTLRYEDPRGCTLTVKFLKSAGGTGREYALAESTGGFCDKLSPGKLSLQKLDAETLSCELTSQDGRSPKVSEKGQLRRVGKKP